MAYRDFREFLDALEKAGELKRIAEPVSPSLEITEIANRVMKSDGPALLFENVVGPPHRLGTPNPRSAVLGEPPLEASLEQSQRFGFPVAINTMGSRKRMSMALGVADFEEHAERIAALLPPPIPRSPADALQLAVRVFKELKSAIPKTVSRGPCQEIVLKGDEVDLTQLPILTCWPEDGGPFLTLPLVFTYDPNTGKRNVGMYRMQLYDRNTCGMHWQMHKTGMRHMEELASPSPLAPPGERGPGGEGHQPSKARGVEIPPPGTLHVAVALGGDPAYTFSAISPLPPGLDEMAFAGFLRRKNAELVQCKTIDMKVPADAEIVLEGYVDPSERRLEGPFGDHTGYYSLAGMFPVFHCTCVTMREKAIYPATIVGQPPMEDGWMGKAVERIFMPMIRLTVPEIVDIHLPIEACFHNVAFVSIKKKYPGHAYKVMNAVWGLGGLAFTKFVFVFDEDVDVQDTAAVLFRLGANCDPGRDALHSRGPVDQLDHASLAEGFGGKIGFDCTHKWPGENGFSRDFPKLIEMSSKVKEKIDQLWPKLGL
ncbi:MAG: UbiD family decarboxylase [Fimbriimonadaceae bacterium]|nr:UbiD family decarboxylase [Fimbriimonadaceae bacterium]QOJ12998.1 MAG: UbiD family decarboxylase [Chthonomonadaceae bacterium]